MSTKKIIIYTGLFDSYDKLSIPLFINQNIEYICFTDNKYLKSKYWKIILIKEKGSGTYLNRKVKMLPHIYLKEYERSIYIDANILLLCSPLKLISYLSNHNFVLFQHPYKHTFLKEIKDNLNHKKINKIIYYEILSKHSNFIFFNIASRSPISANRILIRNHNNKDLIKLMNRWWYDFSNTNLNRDQLILPYLLCSNRNKIKIIVSKKSYNKYFTIRPHKNQSLIIKLKYFLKFSIIEFFTRIIVKIKKF